MWAFIDHIVPTLNHGNTIPSNTLQTPLYFNLVKMEEKPEEEYCAIDEELYAALMLKYKKERESHTDIGSFEDYINKLLSFSLENYIKQEG